MATTNEKIMSIKNIGDCDTVFFFRAMPPGVLVSPNSAKVAAGSRTSITLTLHTVDPRATVPPSIVVS